MPTRLATAINPLDYRPLVVAIARDHLRPGLDLDDLIQAGMTGVIRAAESFDPEGPAPFRSYARKAIHGEIANWIRESRNPIRVPKNTLADARKGREGRRFDDARQVLARRFVGDDAFEGGLADLVEDHRAVEDAGRLAELAACLARELPEPQAAVIRGLFGLDDEPLTPEEVASALALPIDQVEAIKADALALLGERIEDFDRPSLLPESTPEEPITMSVKPGTNGHDQAAASNGHHGGNPRCSACGRAFKNAKVRICYNASCERFRLGAGQRKTAKADVSGPGDSPPPTVSAPTPDRDQQHALAEREFRVMGGIMVLLDTLRPGARRRVVAWFHDAYGSEG